MLDEDKEGRRCPECGSKDIIFDYERGEEICANCGTVLSEHNIKLGPEWRAYTQEEFERRARGGPYGKYISSDKGLTTEISIPSRKYPPYQRARLFRLRKIQRRMKFDRKLLRGLVELDRLTSLMNLPKSMKESAAYIYRKIEEKGGARGYSITSLCAAVIYWVHRLFEVPILMSKIIEYVDNSKSRAKKEISSCIRLIRRKLKSELNYKRTPYEDILYYIPKFCMELNLTKEVIDEALSICEKAREAGITRGKNPAGIAGACIYIAGILKNKRVPQRKIREVANVTEVTIRNRYKEICRNLGICTERIHNYKL
ncbi:MAG TPA: transcription initiation factor IIB [Candidatus Aenigmarchaeota archaeon]|nr:transcription initiation factor IIB [Candidatus Aenigmarchaeota archaeon]